MVATGRSFLIMVSAAFALSKVLGNGTNNDPGIDWGSLTPQLSSTTPFRVTDSEAWFDECVSPFDFSKADAWRQELFLAGNRIVSNYDLFQKPSGLCMQEVACAFTDCGGIFLDTLQQQSKIWTSELGNPPNLPALDKAEILEAARGDDSELPKAVVHPLHVGDVVAAVLFAKENGIGISVKTSGHNWYGSSTRKDTLLLNLSKLRKYSLPETPSDALFECSSISFTSDTLSTPKSETLSNDAIVTACELAEARGKRAVIRFGGGQIVDEALATVDAWNDENPDRIPYIPLVGAAGTVSVTGGWMASGGLSGVGGTKMYGVGVDQVLHVEMVLPDGRFVRFGPSEWTQPEGQQLYPQTTKVTGFCNDGDLSDESNWNWVQCDDEPNFADLWFAIRGGGGGSYGVITSVYWQLHDNTPFEVIAPFLGVDGIVNNENLSDEAKASTLRLWQEFYFTFMFSPSKIRVPTNVSNSCFAADGPTISCFNGGAQIFIDEWAKYSNGTMPLTVYAQGASFYKTLLEVLPNAMGVPQEFFGGRFADNPPSDVVRKPAEYSVMVFPIDVLKNKFDRFIEIWVPCYLETVLYGGSCLSNGGYPYVYGGASQFTSDGMNAYPAHRRNGGIHIIVTNQTVREEFLKLFWEDETGSEDGIFPGLYCHNHLYPGISPRKSNWFQECRVSEGDVVGEGDCMSAQEAAFGTDLLKNLTKIHSEIDPNRLFHTVDGPGYDDEMKEDDVDSSASGISIYGVLAFVVLFGMSTEFFV